MAPPVNGDDGSIASTATVSPAARATRSTALVSVDLPAPGRSGDAHGVGVPTVAVGEAADGPSLVAAALHEGEEPSQRRAIAGARCGEQVGRVVGHRGDPTDGQAGGVS